MAPPRRIRLAVALVAALALALGATVALAGVTVYTNNFSRKSQVKQLKHADGKRCEKRWRRKARSMLIEVKKGPGACGYRPPVEGDSDGPDHDFQAKGKLLRATPKGIRGSAYLAIAVRSGNSSRYELRIFPKKHKYELRRAPAGGAQRAAPEGRGQQGHCEGELQEGGRGDRLERRPGRRAQARGLRREQEEHQQGRGGQHRQPQAAGPEPVAPPAWAGIILGGAAAER